MDESTPRSGRINDCFIHDQRSPSMRSGLIEFIYLFIYLSGDVHPPVRPTWLDICLTENCHRRVKCVTGRNIRGVSGAALRSN